MLYFWSAVDGIMRRKKFKRLINYRFVKLSEFNFYYYMKIASLVTNKKKRAFIDCFKQIKLLERKDMQKL